MLLARPAGMVATAVAAWVAFGAVYLGASRVLGHPDAAALHRLASPRSWT
jgi:hypothetical protein